MHTARSTLLAILGSWTVLVGCGAPPNIAGGGARTASLEAHSSVSCQADADCTVCYRTGTCGEPVAASDPQAALPACHVAPAAFCMPRRARCENHSCVAR